MLKECFIYIYVYVLKGCVLRSIMLRWVFDSFAISGTENSSSSNSSARPRRAFARKQPTVRNEPESERAAGRTPAICICVHMCVYVGPCRACNVLALRYGSCVYLLVWGCACFRMITKNQVIFGTHHQYKWSESIQVGRTVRLDDCVSLKECMRSRTTQCTPFHIERVLCTHTHTYSPHNVLCIMHVLCVLLQDAGGLTRTGTRQPPSAWWCYVGFGAVEKT